MERPARAWIVSLALSSLALTGCITVPNDATTASTDAILPDLDGILPIPVANVMTFTQSFVSAAVGTATDLYEPTMEVSNTGTIYVAGHTIAAATTGTPAYYSNDDGATWAPLPFFASLQTPPPGQGSQPPPGDEGFIVAGDDGQAWMADIYLAGFSVTGWCDNGATQCYDNRNAYDRIETLTAPCNAQGSLNDRPWAAYGGGKLLLVNNPGGGPMQIGVMDVPPSAPVGIGGGIASLNGPTWNYCASADGYIPGVPAMRPDGFFAVPQMTTMGEDNELHVVVGNAADIFAVEEKVVFAVTSGGPGDTNGGRTAFDTDGVLYVGVKNNTVEIETVEDPIFGSGESAKAVAGQFMLALSADEGATFTNATFASVSGKPVQSLYLDGNMAGPGALLVWSEEGETEGMADWYVAHVFPGANGAPELRHVTLAVDEGEPYSAHIIGAAAGPDGRAYFLNFNGGAPADYAGSTPISVWVQTEGETLPVVAMPVEPDA